MNKKQEAKQLLSYIKSSVTAYHAVAEGSKLLDAAGFEKLSMKDIWELKKNGNYYIIPFPTCLFAFSVGDNVKEGQAFRIGTAHTDHPCLHIKPVAELTNKEYFKLNIEIYGGPILNTWLDRPLSIAGRIALKGKDAFHPELRLIDFKKPITYIPNLAIHMNRDVNKGIELMKQTDMIPLLSLKQTKSNEKTYFLDYLAKHCKVKREEIIDFDLFLYNAEEGGFFGMEDEFISAPRLDNLTSCFALLQAIIKGKREDGINLIALYDNEEIGSKSKQGADSALLPMLLKKIYEGLSFNKATLSGDILESILLSVDVAHALHPNKVDKYDPVNQILVNEGVAFKISCNQRYAFDTEVIAILQQLCEENGIKYKKFVNHSDQPGGGTQGPVVSSWLPMRTADLGVPILAMHSARESMGMEDQTHLAELLKIFFSS